MIRQVLLFALVGVALSSSSTTVDPKLNSLLSREGRANVAVSFKGDTSAVLARANGLRFASRGAKATFIKSGLEQLKSSSQINALRLLAGTSLSFRSSWIANRVFIRDATPEIVSALAALPEVTEIREEIVATIVDPLPTGGSIAAEWGVDKVEAPAAWATGVNGTGAVVAIIDTGIRGTHQTLRGSKRGSYDWFDPIYQTDVPTDHQGHGSHCTGSIAGSDGVGVAPGAQWIGCVGCNAWGGCPESDIIACGEWVSCPTLPDGSSPNCNQLADVVSNSWGYWDEGLTFYDDVIRTYHANGVIPVFAAGNEAGCNSIRYPGYHKDVITVGATDSSDNLASFSSRGPAANNLLKPEISAPGVNIMSASHASDTALRSSSGTSMATPHIAGVVALVLSKNPNLTYAQVKDALYNTTDTNLPSVGTCGGTPPNQYPNNMYGYGRVNALKAVNSVSLS